MSCPTTAAYLHHNVLDVHLAETTIAASQLWSHIELAPVKQCPDNYDIVEQLTCQVADKGLRQFPDDLCPNPDVDADFILTFADSMSVITCPDVTVLNAEHTLTQKHPSSVHKMMCKRSSFTAC
jgi:hypothetical protein